MEARQYWENRLGTNWGVQGVGLVALGPHYNKWMYRVQRRVFHRHIGPLAKPWQDLQLLDIGSGTGFYPGLWQELGVKSITLTDIAQVAADRLQQRFPDSECRQLDIADPLPSWLSGRQFDVVSAFAVLFHILEDDRYAAAIQNIAHLVRPGGLFVLSENFLHGPTLRSSHQVSRRLEDIQRTIERAGFRIKSRAPVYVLMNYPVDARPAFSRLWELAMLPAQTVKALGHVWGAVLYPLEVALTALLREAPSTELMICERLP
jgi:SAM-dependent methyltransferase